MRKNIFSKLLITLLIVVLCIIQSGNSFSTTGVKEDGKNIESINVQEVSNYAVDTTEARVSINYMIGAIIGIFRLCLISLSIILITYAIVKCVKLNKKERQTSLKEQKEEKYKIFLASAYGMCMLIVYGILGIVTNCKPIIYLYPEKEQKVKVKLKRKEKLTCTYPKYKDGWEVIAKTNGDLEDCETGRKLYALYWEGKNTVKHNLKEGFIVKGEDSIKFLEEKLAILGLNEREAEEFIVYWLPKLESNKYNFIRFETMQEIDEDMPLEIEPKPDTIIRVMMVFKKVITPFEVVEQKLKSPERKGFTVVEWGGTEI